MQYHIIAICTAIVSLIIIPSIPAVVYLKSFYKKIKPRRHKLASVLLMVFAVISVIPIFLFVIIIVNIHIESNEEYAEMISVKEKLIQYVSENEDDFYKIAEYESSFTYPDCMYYFQDGHSEKHLQEQLGIKLEYPFIIRLGINVESEKVDFVQWHYYTESYDIVFVYPIENYSLNESYEVVCDNIYVGYLKNEH